MRKVIIDTDTGSDDAAAILMAAASSDIEILGVTTLSGNIPIECAVNNALMSLEIAGSNAPVFRGRGNSFDSPVGNGNFRSRRRRFGRYGFSSSDQKT